MHVADLEAKTATEVAVGASEVNRWDLHGEYPKIKLRLA